jgi:hypothetical protein
MESGVDGQRQKVKIVYCLLYNEVGRNPFDKLRAREAGNGDIGV